ncbi:terpene synthase family protein [Sorangium sp. So ce1128]
MADNALATQWMIWLFMFDDQFDDGLPGRNISDIEGTVLEYIELCANPFRFAPRAPAAEALCELFSRTLPRMPVSWGNRFRTHFIRYLSTYSWSAWNHLQGIVPELNSYLENRYHSGGMVPSMDLIELTEGLDLPTEVILSEPVDRLSRACGNVVCWSNDIVSLAKEQARGDVTNLVVVLRHLYKCSLQEAVDRVNAKIVEEVRLFEEIESSLPEYQPGVSSQLKKYIAGLKAWMRGNLDWSAETHRYSSVEETRMGENVSYVESILELASPAH